MVPTYLIELHRTVFMGELRKKLIQQIPWKQDGVLVALLNLMERCYLCSEGGALVDMKDLEVCKSGSESAKAIKRV